MKLPGHKKRLQRKLTRLALSVARYYETELDFSDGSIKDVERVLGLIHKDYLKSKSEDGMNGLALEFGAYIVATIEKNHKEGKLETNHPEFGEMTFPYYWEGQTLFPYVWCLKRILDGITDDVWSKYQVLVLNKDK